MVSAMVKHPFIKYKIVTITNLKQIDLFVKGAYTINMNMRKLFPVLLILCLVLSMCGCSSKNNTNFTSGRISLDTYVSVTLFGCGSDKVARDALDLCDYYSGIFSRTDKDSLLYKLNEKGELDITGDDEKILADVIRESLKISEETEGALDIAIEPLTSLWNFKEGDNVPDDEDIEKARENTDYTKIKVTDDKIELNGARLDLGAVAKGYIADRICDFLRDEGAGNAVVSLGGNVKCIGTKADGDSFTIGIQKPFGEQSDVIAALKLTDMSAVTSGIYERYFYKDDKLYHHILDPATGYPCDNGLLSVTIISEDSFVCDALSTGCFVMGKDNALKLINSMEGVYAVIVDSCYNVIYSDGAEDFLKK